MIARACLTALFLSLAPVAAFAQPLYGNPFADAAFYRAARTTTSDATYRLRYEMTQSHTTNTPIVLQVTIDVAPDWSLVRDAAGTVLYDFQINRTFAISGDTFSTSNGLAALVFRVTERQNRTNLRNALDAAGAGGQFPEDCDADTELGLAIPGAASGSRMEVREQRGVISVRCGDREIGTFTPSDNAAPPPAFWPTAFYLMTAHPALRQRMRASGHPPAVLEARYRPVATTEAQQTWRLIGVETVAIPYPLNASMRNVTAAQLDELLAPGVGQIATDAIAARDSTATQTLQGWDAYVREVERRDGRAAAAMLLMPTFNLFPEFECVVQTQLKLCELLRGFRDIADPAPMAVLEVGMAEQRSDNAAAIAAMQRAQASPLRDHPALAASFALALLKFDDRAFAQARAANLPTDIRALRARALSGLPYIPAYWTDVADNYGRNYNWPAAFLLYDVAFSLPAPSAMSSAIMRDRRSRLEPIRRDFPDASLPTTP